MYLDVNPNSLHNNEKLKILEVLKLRIQRLRHKTHMLISWCDGKIRMEIPTLSHPKTLLEIDKVESSVLGRNASTSPLWCGMARFDFYE